MKALYLLALTLLTTVPAHAMREPNIVCVVKGQPYRRLRLPSPDQLRYETASLKDGYAFALLTCGQSADGARLACQGYYLGRLEQPARVEIDLKNLSGTLNGFYKDRAILECRQVLLPIR